MEERAFAKLNLALHVRAREADGYHRIETVFAFVEEGDRLSAAPADALSLTIAGPFAARLGSGGDNLVIRAAQALRERFAVEAGAALTLDKRLPVASGIGGGSADAAATLRLLTRFWGLPEDRETLLAIARSLGADVAACLGSVTARGEGRGDELVPIEGASLSGRPVLLVNPGVAVSTAAVFAGWDGVDCGPLPPGAVDGRNDLEPSARVLAPEIGAVLDALRSSPGASLVRMSGSGATCFALFDDEPHRDAASASIAAAQPGWWRLASRLR